MKTPSDNDGRDSHEGSIQAWWSAVVSGEPTTAHPVHSGLRVRLSHSTLELSGVVTTENGHQDVLREAQSYCGDTIEDVEDDIEIVPESEAEAGILSQAVFSIFENTSQAARAAEVLRQLSTVDTSSLVLLASADSPELASVPEAYRADVIEALAAGRGVLVATVDETGVFALRERLDQDTASLKTVVTPPEATRSGAGRGSQR